MDNKCKLLAFSLLHQMGVEYRRRGSLCSDGQNCIYAELLDLEERKVVELEEKAEELREKLKKSVEELAAVKQAHLKFISEVGKIAKTKRSWKKALQVFTEIKIMISKYQFQELLRRNNAFEDTNCDEEDSYMSGNLSQDEDPGSSCHIGASSEVEEIEVSYAEEQTTKVVVDEVNVTRKVHEVLRSTWIGVVDSIEKQLQSMGEGSPPSSTSTIINNRFSCLTTKSFDQMNSCPLGKI